jgi:hypothetical protein
MEHEAGLLGHALVTAGVKIFLTWNGGRVEKRAVLKAGRRGNCRMALVMLVSASDTKGSPPCVLSPTSPTS